jgi:hypothetical protein
MITLGSIWTANNPPLSCDAGKSEGISLSSPIQYMMVALRWYLLPPRYSLNCTYHVYS